jgi:type III pantothenate kinase
MVIRPEDEKAIGADRVCNLAAAYEQMGKACVVVDAGTAITIDVCDDAGGFLGGAIAPGAGLMLKSLHEAAARLPLVSPAKPAEAIGQTTEQAMLSGVYYGIRGMVKELVEAYAEKLGAWPEVIATGGDAQLLFGDWELTHAVSPDLTLYGIALTFSEHYIRHPEG